MAACEFTPSRVVLTFDPVQDPVKLAQDPLVKKFIEEQMTATGTKMELRGFEFVKKIHLTAEDFSVTNGLLTPTFKLKRHEAKKKFAAVIEQMYSETPVASKL